MEIRNFNSFSNPLKERKKKGFLWTMFLLFSFAVQGQEEHYRIQSKFSYAPTAAERQMLPTWYKQVRSGTTPNAPVTALAEFDNMGGVLIAYPLGIPVNLVSELSMITSVKVMVYPATDSNTAKTYFQSSGVNMANIEFWVINHDTYWVRDFGPWFIVDGNDEIGVVDFTYNRPQRPNDDAAMEQIAQKMNLSRYEMPMVHTGGNYMVDGFGTVASTSLILEENPTETSSTLTTMAHNYLGTDTYLITNDPLGDYIAHIDCWGKFLAPNKVLIAQVPTTDSRYTEYEIAANLFANTPSAWGENYQVYRVYEPGTSAVTPYTNSLIVEDHVFVPVTGTQWDDAAIQVYTQAMPGYTIVPIMQAEWTPWYNTDALHCRTHELADTGMLFLRHTPVVGEQPVNQPVTISAEIKPTGGQSLICDSMMVFYRINQGEWQAMLMGTTGGTSYEAVLVNLPEGGEVDYYVFAADQSGRHACQPYMGKHDPHHFTMTPLGVENLMLESSIQVFPNPATDKVVVRAEGVAEICVYDSRGRQIGQQLPTGSLTTIACSDWPTGVYVVSVKDETGRTYRKKIIKID